MYGSPQKPWDKIPPKPQILNPKPQSPQKAVERRAKAPSDSLADFLQPWPPGPGRSLSGV